MFTRHEAHGRYHEDMIVERNHVAPVRQLRERLIHVVTNPLGHHHLPKRGHRKEGVGARKVFFICAHEGADDGRNSRYKRK